MGLPKTIAGIAIADALMKASASALAVVLGVKVLKKIRARRG